MSDKDMTAVRGHIRVAIAIERSTSEFGVQVAAATVRAILEKLGKPPDEVDVEDDGKVLIVAAGGPLTLFGAMRDDDGQGPRLLPPISR